MSILTSTPTTADQFKQKATNTYNLMVNQYTILYNLFWKNPTLTPAEVATALGTDAAAFVTYAYSFYSFLNSVAPVNLPALQNITINDDGTITLTPFSSSSSSSADSSSSSSS